MCTEDTKKIFPIIRDILFIAAIYIYFAGWSYAFCLFKEFNIPLNTANIPFYYFLVYSYSVIFNLFSVLGFIILFIIICLAYKRKGIFIIIAVLFALLSLYLLYFNASRIAFNDVKDMRYGEASAVKITFKDQFIKQYPLELTSANVSNELKYVTQTNDRLYVFHQPISDTLERPYCSIFSIALDDTLLIKTEAQNIIREE